MTKVWPEQAFERLVVGQNRDGENAELRWRIDLLVARQTAGGGREVRRQSRALLPETTRHDGEERDRLVLMWRHGPLDRSHDDFCDRTAGVLNQPRDELIVCQQGGPFSRWQAEKGRLALQPATVR